MKSRYGVVLACVLVVSSVAAQSPSDQAQQFRQEWAACEARVQTVSAALALAQPFRMQAVSGELSTTVTTRELATRQTEERIAALYAKANDGAVLDPKTGKVTPAKPKDGK